MSTYINRRIKTHNELGEPYADMDRDAELKRNGEVKRDRMAAEMYANIRH